MLIAHVVPGYFAVVQSQPYWNAEWNKPARRLLWGVTLASTIVPDADVIYNALFRGFINHSTLWTHSLFVHGGVALLWLLLRLAGRWSYLQMLVGLAAIGGLSHLLLDMVSHGTPIFYPLSMMVIGTGSARVIAGGFWWYITDPTFLVEPVLVTMMVVHWLLRQSWQQPFKRSVVVGVLSGLVIFCVIFLLMLPRLQALVG